MGTQCPESMHLCHHSTVSRGLCVENETECNTRSEYPRSVPGTPVNIIGRKYSYSEDYLGRHCYFTEGRLKVDYDMSFTDGEEVPSKFSCLTYNIWGLAKNKSLQKLFTLRKQLLEKTIRESTADILCLQEMSKYAYDNMKDLIQSYKFASEIPYPAEKGRPIHERNRQVDTYLLCKYKPSRVILYGFPGVLGYENSLLVVEFKNLIVFNLYNQAGSKHSPGQEYKWIHYSRCRYDILETILDMIKARYSDKNIIVCGDFNFHLDGSLEDWPEMAMLNKYKEYGFIDTFRKVNPEDPGLTEDTDRNPMRFNQKLIEKKYRYDGIFYRPSIHGWSTISSKLIGTTFECLTKEDSKWFIENMSEVKDDHTKLIRCSDNTLPINPSDHFGVLTTFRIESKKGGKRKTKKARKH